MRFNLDPAVRLKWSCAIVLLLLIMIISCINDGTVSDHLRAVEETHWIGYTEPQGPTESLLVTNPSCGLPS